MRDEFLCAWSFPTDEAAARARDTLLSALEGEGGEAGADLAGIVLELTREAADVECIERDGRTLRATVVLHSDIDRFAEDGGGPTTDEFWEALGALVAAHDGRLLSPGEAARERPGHMSTTTVVTRRPIADTEERPALDPALLDARIEPRAPAGLPRKDAAVARAPRLLALAGIAATVANAKYDYANDRWSITLRIGETERDLPLPDFLGDQHVLVPALNALAKELGRAPSYRVLVDRTKPPRSVVVYASEAELPQLLAAGLAMPG